MAARFDRAHNSVPPRSHLSYVIFIIVKKTKLTQDVRTIQETDLQITKAVHVLYYLSRLIEHMYGVTVPAHTTGRWL